MADVVDVVQCVRFVTREGLGENERDEFQERMHFVVSGGAVLHPWLQQKPRWLPAKGWMAVLCDAML